MGSDRKPTSEALGLAHDHPCLLTGALVAKWNFLFPRGQAWSQSLLMLRNLSLIAIPLTWLVLPAPRRGAVDPKIT